MFEKTAAPPAGEKKSNDIKATVDTLAAELLDLDQDKLKKEAKTIKQIISSHWKPTEDGPIRLVVCGAAGSGKTTIAGALSNEFGISEFDLDEYIVGGFTPNEKEYKARFLIALATVWIDMPGGNGWILEHVRAADPDVIAFFKPNFALLVDPGKERIERTAEARNMVGTEDKNRIKRALETMETSKKQWDSISSKAFAKGSNWRIKKIEG